MSRDLPGVSTEAWGQTGDKSGQCGQASAEEQGEGCGEGPHSEQQAAKKPQNQAISSGSDGCCSEKWLLH